MDIHAFVTSLVTSFVIFVLLVLLFTWLSRRPANHVVYYPNRLLKGLGPPENANRRRPWDWIVEAWHTTEDDLIAMSGLDAAVYMVFVTSMLSILVYTACYSLPVLLTVSATDRNPDAKPGNLSSFDNFSMANVHRKSRIWAFVIGAYWLSICTYFVLWRSYRHVVKLRARELASPKAKPEHFTVMVRDIPPPSDGSYAEEVDAFFRKLHPETYAQSLVVMDISKVAKAWEEVESYKRKLARAETEATKGKKRPQRRSGWMGLIGPEIDAIDFYNHKLKQALLCWEAERVRAEAERQKGAALVFFNTRAAAAQAGQTLHSLYAHQWAVEEAPPPKAIVWENVPVPITSRLIRRIIIYILVFFIIFFYMIPITLIALLFNLESLRQKLPTFLKPLVDQPIIVALLQAYLPQLLLLLFLAFLPALLQRLSKAEGLPSVPDIYRAAAGKYFYFNVFNVFLGVTLAGTVISSIVAILNHPRYIVDFLSSTLPRQADFFITYIALRFFAGYGFELSRLVSLIVYHLKRIFLCKTDDEIQEAWNPGPPSYSTLVPNDMLTVTIALCYAIIAPLILPFAILYFALAWLVMRNQFLNVYVATFDSYGRMWPHIHSRILASLFVSQLTMLGYFSTKAKKEFAFYVVMIPLPIATVIFAYICKKFYYRSFTSTPLSAARAEVKEMLSVPAIVEEYTPPCLLGEEKWEDIEEKFEDARSNLSSRTSSGFMSPVSYGRGTE